MSPPQSTDQNRLQEQGQQQRESRPHENGKKRKRPQKGTDTGPKKKNAKQSHNNDQNIDSVFDRVIDRRQEEVARLEPALIRVLLMDIREASGIELPSLAAAKSSPSTSLSAGIDGTQAAREVRNLFSEQYKTISNDGIEPDKRRKAYEVVKEIFDNIDTLTGKGDKPEIDENTRATAKPSLSRIRTTENEEDSPTELPLLSSKKQNKATGKSNKIANANGASNASPTSATVTTNSTTNLLNSKPNSSSEISTSKTTTQKPSAPSSPKRKAAPSVAYLSSASALTAATAADSSSTSATASTSSQRQNSRKDPPIHPSMLRGAVPPGTEPPPYQKRSLTAQQHRNHKLQKSQQVQHQKKHRDKIHPAMISHSSDFIGTTRIGTKKTTNLSAPTTLPNSTESTATTAKTSTTTSSAVNPGSNNNASPTGSKSAAVTRTARTSTLPNTAVASSHTSASPANVSASSSSTSTESSSGSNTKTSSSANAKTSSSPAKVLNILFLPDVPVVKEKPIVSSTTTSITLSADNSKSKPTQFANYVVDRPWVQLTFKQYSATNAMKDQFLHRLQKWDPFWISEKDFCTGLTSPVTQFRYEMNKKCDYTPQTAARFDIYDLLKIAGPKIRSIPQGQNPVDNELRILVRMLPLDLSKQKDGGKNRADVHLWPKGTYMQIHFDPDSRQPARPQILYQRKQQSHDHKKWLGVCKHLDITTMVHSMWSSTASSLKRSSRHATIEIGCYDPELYVLQLALCRYRSPQTLSKTLLTASDSRIFKRVGLEEMYERIKKKTEVLDCESDDDVNGGQSDIKADESFRFPIRDPLTLAAMEAPVRGRNCLHLTCFGLNSFLDVNKSASGQRWKCGNCNKFLSYADLEYCSLTERAAKMFGDQIGPLQYTVELREDKSMVLCKARMSHQERARARKIAADAGSQTKTDKQTGGIAARTNEVVELLDSDSD